MTYFYKLDKLVEKLEKIFPDYIIQIEDNNEVTFILPDGDSSKDAEKLIRKEVDNLLFDGQIPHIIFMIKYRTVESALHRLSEPFKINLHIQN